MHGRKWKIDIPLVFAPMVLTRTLSACKAREIRARIYHRLDIWERVIQAGLVGGGVGVGNG